MFITTKVHRLLLILLNAFNGHRLSPLSLSSHWMQLRSFAGLFDANWSLSKTIDSYLWTHSLLIYEHIHCSLTFLIHVIRFWVLRQKSLILRQEFLGIFMIIIQRSLSFSMHIDLWGYSLASVNDYLFQSTIIDLD